MNSQYYRKMLISSAIKDKQRFIINSFQLPCPTFPNYVSLIELIVILEFFWPT